jgi:hypothetical protein
MFWAFVPATDEIRSRVRGLEEGMAQITVVQLVDDLDGTSDSSIQTVRFELDGMSYEIDLHDGNAAKLRDQLAEFIDAAWRTPQRQARRPAAATTGRAMGARRNREQSLAIRAWARQNGHEVAERGRIPTGVIRAFETQAGKQSKGPGH